MSKELLAILGMGITILGGIYVTWNDTRTELREVRTDISRMNSRVSKIEGILEERQRSGNVAQGTASD